MAIKSSLRGVFLTPKQSRKSANLAKLHLSGLLHPLRGLAMTICSTTSPVGEGSFVAMIKCILIFLLTLTPTLAFSKTEVVNIYAWTGELPGALIQQFEKETGIKVNFSEYENNEIMYAKLRATPKSGYDIIMPTSNMIDRMIRQNLLEPLDHAALSNWKNIHPHFLHLPYDPDCRYNVPFIWGVTGIFINQTYFPSLKITKWQDFWLPRFNNQLLMLDDMRDSFSVALLSLGYTANDTHPAHIREAFLKLKALMQNIKMFSTETVVSMIIDEDATVGMAWNGDALKASEENPHVQFVFPKEGFTIWIDSFAIPRNAPHRKAAYQFINFILRPEIAKQIALETGYPIANLSGQKLLPKHIQTDPVIYPSETVLKRGQYLLDINDETLALYEQYWEELKMGT